MGGAGGCPHHHCRHRGDGVCGRGRRGAGVRAQPVHAAGVRDAGQRRDRADRQLPDDMPERPGLLARPQRGADHGRHRHLDQQRLQPDLPRRRRLGDDDELDVGRSEPSRWIRRAVRPARLGWAARHRFQHREHDRDGGTGPCRQVPRRRIEHLPAARRRRAGDGRLGLPGSRRHGRPPVPGCVRRHSPGAGRRQRHLLGRRHRRHARRGPLRRVVARRRLPEPVAAAARPVDLRRLRRCHDDPRQRQRDDPGVRVPDTGGGHGECQRRVRHLGR